MEEVRSHSDDFHVPTHAGPIIRISARQVKALDSKLFELPVSPSLWPFIPANVNKWLATPPCAHRQADHAPVPLSHQAEMCYVKIPGLPKHRAMVVKPLRQLVNLRQARRPEGTG